MESPSPHSVGRRSEGVSSDSPPPMAAVGNTSSSAQVADDDSVVPVAGSGVFGGLGTPVAMPHRGNLPPQPRPRLRVVVEDNNMQVCSRAGRGEGCGCLAWVDSSVRMCLFRRVL